MVKISGVYEILNLLNNHRYIGSSVNIEKRFKEHKYSLWNNNHRSIYLQRAWNKYGEDKFKFNILETCEPIKDTILFLEQKYLYLNPEYNICPIAGSSLGVKRSEEYKLNMSVIKKGIAHTRRLTDEEFINFKKKHSDRALSSQWVKNMRKPIIMLDKKTRVELKEFSSAVEAAIFLGRRNKQTGISSAALGLRPSSFGYKWKFKNIKNGL